MDRQQFHKEQLKEIINGKYRRLYQLQQKQAIYGLSVDPSIILEIEDLLEEINELEGKLNSIGTTEAHEIATGERVGTRREELIGSDPEIHNDIAQDTVTWLHLSDLHFKVDSELNTYNQGVVFNALWKDIAKQIDNGLQPDLILFSGDLAFSGAQKEYNAAIKCFFEPLLEVTGLPKDRLLVVPGNHDVDWKRINNTFAKGMLDLSASRDKINQFLFSRENRKFALNKFSAYKNFVNKFLGGYLEFDDENYFYTHNIQLNGHSISILGLNSAWMCGLHKDADGKINDQGHLLIGEIQLQEALKKSKKSDFRIALVHHPIDWLHDVDRFSVEKRLNAECDFVLHGHWHIPQVNIKQGLAGRTVYIPAGSIYAWRDYPNGYNFVQFDINNRQAKIYLRRYNDNGPRGPEWIKDINATGEAQDGMVTVDLH